MNHPLKSIVLALSACVAVHAPVLAKGPPEPAAPSASSAAYMTRTVTTWMLVYEASSSAKPDFGHVDDIASEDECESTWKSMASIARNPDLLKHKCIRVEKRAR